MEKTGSRSISAFLKDRFAPEWKLLSETESYLIHTPDGPAYESQFKEWRARLHNMKTGDTELVTLRSEIVALRKQLRLEGYDLSLGLQQLVVRGFRNDDSVAEGFQRVVLCFCGPHVYFQTGSANHIALAEELVDTLTKRKLMNRPEMHYLWYKRTPKGLYLSGSATETASDFRRMEGRAEANPMKLLSSLKNLG
ncbi:hypothetical protein K7J14_14240 [Treponema zuelzerae]|uniref:Uncharacterized protein n=1 Tax=Teretinema zuelzerae TaxID=156 RepID=A0AAE3EJG5_9SPIR|nr:hypothetical protein [Teretinema zuelzerae]MBN2810327.1 hypothetical protein [Spirochaetales bacterium]MCD1655854.1 hypothetical protein [Teretinema zuelzerae]HPO01708.1 hypothetical protein [Treponemataceae bacterium]